MKTISKRYDKYFVVLYDKDDNFFKSYDNIKLLANDLNYQLYELYRKIRNKSSICIDHKRYIIRLYSNV